MFRWLIKTIYNLPNTIDSHSERIKPDRQSKPDLKSNSNNLKLSWDLPKLLASFRGLIKNNRDLPTTIKIFIPRLKTDRQFQHDVEAIAFGVVFGLFVIGIGVVEMINPWFLDRHQVAVLLFVAIPLLVWFGRLYFMGSEEDEN